MSVDCLLRGKVVFVMGGGKFGTNALRYLKVEGTKVLVADVNPDCIASSEVDVLAENFDVLDSLLYGQAALLVGNAINILVDMLESRVPDLVVTAISGNAVAKIIEVYLAKHGIKFGPYRKAVPKVLENIPKSLVSVVDEDSGVIVVSYMALHLRCRENCMPPKNFCALTGRSKLASMDQLLQFAVHNHTDVSCILISRQLRSGIGAINGKDLDSFLKQLDCLEVPYTLAVGTACDCHGILNLGKVT